MRIDGARNKEKIRHAAIQILSQADIEKIPLEEIARKASVTRATLYNHYSSREELLLEIVLSALEFVCRRMEEIQSFEAPSLEDVMNGLFDLYTQHKEALELGGCQTLSNNQQLKESHHRFMSLFITLLTRVQPEGFPLGQDFSLGLISKIYIPILQQIQSLELPEREKKQRFLHIMKGALSL